MRAPRHYGWPVSPYTAKTRSYLRFAGVEFVDIVPTAWVLSRRIQKAVGRLIMPTVELADGRWLQDSSVIIDHFDSAPSAPSITPSGSTQRFASSLLEVFADEWLPMAALHYRWNTADNVEFALDEFSRSGFPWLPRFVAQPLIKPLATRMQSYLGVLGVDDTTRAGVEETVDVVISALEAQLGETAFVLGDRPCLGDFSLYGPLWAHLYRDPGSRFLFDKAPHVRRWMAALSEGALDQGDFLPDDHVPKHLEPLFRCILEDQWAWIRTLIGAIDAYCEQHPQAKRVPRALGTAPFSIRGHQGQRKLITFVQWKAQRAVAAYELNRERHTAWMLSVMGEDGADCALPAITHPMKLVSFKAVLDTD